MEWIDVNVLEPPENQLVLGWGDNEYYIISLYSRPYLDRLITHWKLLPAPPGASEPPK